jgi:SAM-dependent methyltransferase
MVPIGAMPQTRMSECTENFPGMDGRGLARSPLDGLSDPEFVCCDLCGADTYDVVLPNTIRRTIGASDFSVCGELHEHPQIVRCQVCSLVYANPRDAVGSLHAKYEAVEPDAYLAEDSSRRATFRGIVSTLQKRIGAGRVLDVGCSAGLFLEVLPSCYEGYGLEPSVQAAQVAQRRLGSRVRCGSLRDATFDEGMFDLVTLWDVLEHLERPRHALAAIHRWTRPGGWLALITPDMGSPTARLLRGRWPHLIRQHLYYFTQTSMDRLLASSGYQVIERPLLLRQFTLKYLLQRVRLIAPEAPNRWDAALWFRHVLDWRIPITLFDDMFIIARRMC